MKGGFDLVIRGGRVFDGKGGDAHEADVGVRDGVIAALGKDLQPGREEIDARGLIVTPGFVDIHTHFDAHVTWASQLLPSSLHGVTTAVIGNCGVGFAPCRPQEQRQLIKLMEGIEDIPEIVLDEGLSWDWQTFPEYLDVVGARHFDIDVAAYIPHGPLRVFVMGERAGTSEAATPEDMAKMREIVREAMNAGALGFATSRSLNHRSTDGALTPSYAAAEEELTAIALGMADAGRGVLQAISDWDDPEGEFAMLRRVCEISGRPLTFSLLQLMSRPDRWEPVLKAAENAAKEGFPVSAQVCGRPIGVHAGFGVSFNPFSFCPSYQDIGQLPIEERLVAMRDPERRARIVAEYPADSWEAIAKVLRSPDNMYVMNDPPNYEPPVEESLGAQARRLGVPPAEHIYDVLTSGDGKTLLFVPVGNYAEGNLEAVERMLRSDVVVPGLGDAGAHCGIICDASLPTYMLMRWTFEEKGKLSLAGTIKALSSDTARAVGLHDRGRIEIGLRADLNVIDVDRLSLDRPQLMPILPANGGQLVQHAEGYVATLVAGQITYREGQSTGALPGRLVRPGTQSRVAEPA